jgi:hypothetical protein
MSVSASSMTMQPALLLDVAMALMDTGGLFLILSSTWQYRAICYPIHPADMPNHLVGLTAIQHNQIISQCDSDLLVYEICNGTINAVKQQLLQSVNGSYLCALEDHTYGFITTTPLPMLQHLHAATLTLEELEVNDLQLAKLWNSELPIEGLRGNVDNILHQVCNGNSSISNVTTITILQVMFETSGPFVFTTNKFGLQDLNQYTLASFKIAINPGNTERLNKLTTGATGYNGACVENSGPLVHYDDDKAVRTTPWIKLVSKKKRRTDAFRSEYIRSGTLMDKQK